MDYTFFPNAIDIDKFKFSINRRKLIRKENHVSDEKVYGHVGRLTEQKNHRKILRIFAEILKQDPSAKLWIIGEGELKNTLLQYCEVLQIKGSVNFLGIKSNVQDFYSAMDAFIFPSKYEGLPVTVLETQANGLPSVISDKITKQVEISKAIKVVPLEKSDKIWALSCMEASQQGHLDTSIEMNTSVFRIETAAKNLEQFYIRHNEEAQ